MQLRPSYRYECTGESESAIEKLREALHEPDATCRGRASHGKLELIVDDKQPHFWAPELRARVFDEGNRVVVQGHFAPKPDTWTMFLAIYAATVFSTGVGTVFGLAQWQLGTTPWALWSVPIGAAAVGLVWLGARMGQRLGSDNMDTLRKFVEEHLPCDESQEPP